MAARQLIIIFCPWNETRQRMGESAVHPKEAAS
jgi:hypothetical protein